MPFKKSQLEILCCSKTIQQIEFTGRLQELRNLCAAIVKVGNSNKQPTYFQRIMQHLIPIEVKSSTKNEDTWPIADVSNQAVRL